LALVVTEEREGRLRVSWGPEGRDDDKVDDDDDDEEEEEEEEDEERVAATAEALR
jgi:hypothetical protein